MSHVMNAKTGKRLLLTAKFIPNKGQPISKCLPVIEKALIRHFLSEGCDLANVQGTRLLRHEITSSGSKRVPASMFVDKGKGE